MSRVDFVVTWEGIAAGAYLGAVVTVVDLFLWISILQTVPAGIAVGV